MMMSGMRRCCYRVGWVPLLLASLAVAQEPPKQPTRNNRTAKNAQRVQIVRPSDLEAGKERIIKVLKLNKRQQAGLDIIIKSYEARFAELSEQYRASLDDLEEREDMTALIREAHNRGDTEQVEYLRQQLKESRKIRREKLAVAHESMQAAQKELHDDITSILLKKQKEDFEKLWDEGLRPPPKPKPPVRHPRAVLSLVERLEDLTKKQKDQVYKLFGDFYAKHRTLDRVEAKETLPARQKKLIEDVLDVLTEKQREKIVKQLKGRQKRATP
ncbi:MAG: hypothetical protein MI923_20555 [Phycisphaerales bacterium]|nr:hypothetical protein [Phycisphaerales bacterium]